MQHNTPKNSLNSSLKTLRIVTRKSALALWQANFVKDKLQALYPDLEIILIGVTTEGDQILDVPLTKMGGKGLFVKALEEHLLNHTADIAVHSIKDMPAALPDGLTLTAILEREDPSDAFISLQYPSLEALPPQATIGTSSLRRQAQLYALRRDLTIKMLRGNIDTRVQKLDNNEYDAIILATAGLKRLGLAHRITQSFSTTDSTTNMLPAVGQGALGIECRITDAEIRHLIMPLHHTPTAQCVLAERNMNALLGGSCQSPVAGLAVINDDGLLKLEGMVATPDGQTILKAWAIGNPEAMLMVGKQVAEQLLEQGAEDIIKVAFG
ncbi:MAG TPA: hydroxymethylbilane synthase [Gammaproteobacteria bacterium]|nr:hydroxymethylbilane synthase [Gammaproteobacteria bacterium]